MGESNDFMVKFLSKNKVPKETLEHFSSTPWTNKYLQNASYEAIPTYSRVLKPTGEDYFFSTTVSTPITIPHYLTLKLRNFNTLPSTKPSESSRTDFTNHKQATVVPEKPDCLFLLHLGERGVDGHDGVAHGGMICAILDETMGLMIMLHHNNVAGDTRSRDLLFTANLNVNYRAQVSTPGNYMVRTWLTKREERKWYSKGQVIDQNGKIMAEGDGLWLTTKSKL